ncbi:MAG: FkbM family methyltransferase [Actinomycetia bacterium]|nr:FkbM family methyltransferase [Actinomycetes bacterium]
MTLGEGELARIGLTVSCRDTDAIPKVPGAGEVVDGVQLMHNGVKVVEGGYYGDWMTEVIRVLRGHHEPQEEVAFHAVVERLAATTGDAPVMVELGAFWAYYSLWFKQRLPQGRAYLVEPDPAYLDVGRRNFELNGFEGTFHQAAIGRAKAAPAPFECESDGQTRPVPVEGLASILDRFHLPFVDVLFSDIQGFEWPLLDGGRDVLAGGRIRFLVVSTHHHVISGDPLTHQRCLELLREVGAHVILEHTVAESYSGDGLIVVSFDERDRDLEVVASRCRVGSSWFGDPLKDLEQAYRELGKL